MTAAPEDSGVLPSGVDRTSRRAPGPRPLVQIVAAKRKSTGEPVDMAEIPLEYHNSAESRRRQRLGELPAPWGPPPDDEPPEMEIPEHIRRLIE